MLIKQCVLYARTKIETENILCTIHYNYYKFFTNVQNSVIQSQIDDAKGHPRSVPGRRNAL